MAAFSSSSMSVFRSPYALALGVKEEFPTASVQIAPSSIPGKSALEVRISGITPFLMERMVLKKKFFDTIYTILCQIGSTIDRNDKALTPLVYESFSLEAPLKGWKAFHRHLYESEEKGSCVSLIVEFFRGNLPSETLIRMGLHTEQVEKTEKKVILDYFREFVLHIQDFPDKRDLLIAYKKNYPCTFSRLSQEYVKDPNSLPARPVEVDSYEHFLERLKKDVIAQEKAVQKVAFLLASQKRVSTTDCYLFVGPSGVGKTELARAIGRIYGDRLVRFDMQQYSTPHSSSDLFGSPTGYIGSTSKPHLACEFERLKPIQVAKRGAETTYQIVGAVILFDELEKAAAETKQSLLKLFDEKECTVRYTAGSNNVSLIYQLINCVIVGTSNLFQLEILRGYAQGKSTEELSDFFKLLNQNSSQRDRFSPELLNRMSIVPFGPIPRGVDYQKILSRKYESFIGELKVRFDFRDISTTNVERVLEVLEGYLYGQGDDIRKIEKYFIVVMTDIATQLTKCGDIKNVKVLFMVDEERFCAQFFVYSSMFEDDIPIELMCLTP